MKGIIYLFTSLIISLLLACNKTESDTPDTTIITPSPQTNGCTIPDNSFANLTENVLIGTDVDQIKNVKIGTERVGQFSLDMGGAIIEVNIEKSKTGYTATRSYNEPGASPNNKTYTELCIKNGLIYGKTIRGQFTQDSLLWLELNSDNEFISPELWMVLN